MPTINELVEEIKNDKIKNEDLIIILEHERLGLAGMAIFKIIERNYCNEKIVNRLAQLGKLLKDNKFLGPWQFGHAAIATLALVDDDYANSVFNEIFEELDDIDKFLVNNFIQSQGSAKNNRS